MRTEESGHKKPAKMARIIKTPARAFSKALDLYVKGMINFSNAYNRPLRIAVEVSPAGSQRLPRSFTTSRLLDNYDQPPEGAIVRSISAPAACGRATNIGITSFELQMIQRHCRQMQPISGCSKKVPIRRCCAGMGKIDEERASSFRDDNINVLKSNYKLGMVKDEDSFFGGDGTQYCSYKHARDQG